MRDNSTNIIKYFFYHKTDEPLRTKFAWWLLNEDKEIKEPAMEEIWNGLTPNEDKERTDADLAKLHSKMKAGKRRLTIFRRLKAVAAVMLIFVLGGASAWLISRHHYGKETAAVEYLQVSTANGEVRNVVLPDSSLVTLNSNSVIVYPARFMGKERQVYLSGEAVFDVRHDDGQPFIVDTRYLKLTDVGTVFDVNAYPENNRLMTIVESGCVNSEIKGSDGKQYRLTANKAFSYDIKSGKVEINDADASKMLSWRDGNLVFQGNTMEEIVKILQQHFKVQIVCKDPESFTGVYYASFTPDDSLTVILSLLSNISTPFTFEQHDNVVVIKPE